MTSTSLSKESISVPLSDRSDSESNGRPLSRSNNRSYRSISPPPRHLSPRPGLYLHSQVFIYTARSLSTQPGLYLHSQVFISSPDINRYRLEAGFAGQVGKNTRLGAEKRGQVGKITRLDSPLPSRRRSRRGQRRDSPLLRPRYGFAGQGGYLFSL